MKQYLFLLALIATFPLHAQDVWKEGTQWEVTFENDSVVTYALYGHTSFAGVEYLNLITLGIPSLPSYVRAERGDTVVYAKAYVSGELSEEFVLYDFGTFEPGTSLQYSETDTVTHALTLQSVIIDADSLSYYHDVIEDGDILPCYKDIVFKVGHLGGPIFLIDNYMHHWGGGDTKPKRKNISHTVLKLTNNRTMEFWPAGIISMIVNSPDYRYYNLQGIRVTDPLKGVFILNGKKYVK